MDQETLEALQQLEQGLRTEIQTGALATQRLIAESEDRTRGQFEGVHARIAQSEDRTRQLIAESEDRTRAQFEGVHALIAESEDRTRRHFDVVAESLRGDIRVLAEGVAMAAEGSVRRDAELGERIDRLEHRFEGLESRVTLLESPRRRRRRR